MRCPKLVFEALEKQTSAVGRVAVQVGRQTERGNVVDLESEIHPTDVQQALHKETRRGEQHHGERDLRRGEQQPDARGAFRAGRLASLVLERRDEVGPRAVERGEEPEEQARGERQADSEQDDGAADAEGDRVLHFGRQQRDDEHERPVCDDHAGNSAEDRQQQRFGEELAD